jgi:hypothetical protein
MAATLAALHPLLGQTLDWGTAWAPPLPGVALVPVRPWLVGTVILTSTLLHGLIFALAPRSKAEPHLSRERVMATVHAVATTVAVTVWLWYDGLARLDDPSQLRSGVAGTTDEWCALVLAYSCGYFITDTIIMLTHKETWDVGSVLHHFVIFPSVLLALLGGASIPLQFLFFCEELSTPFLHARAASRTTNRRLYNIYSALFALTFFLSRLGWGSFVFVLSLRTYWAHRALALPTLFLEGQIWWQLTMCTLSRVLNLYWATLIVSKMLRGDRSMGRAQPSPRPKAA